MSLWVQSWKPRKKKSQSWCRYEMVWNHPILLLPSIYWSVATSQDRRLSWADTEADQNSAPHCRVPRKDRKSSRGIRRNGIHCAHASGSTVWLHWGYGDMVRLSKFSSNGGLACGVLINEMLHGCKPTWPSNMDWNGWKSFWTKSDLRFRLVQKLDVPQYVPQLIWMIQINRWIVIDRSMRIFIGKWFVRTGISGACHWGNRKAKPGNIRGPPRKRGDN